MTQDPLFSSLQLGPLELPNRVLMSPLTRSRAAQPGDVPQELNAEYYAQRASAGLIISEATQVSPQGKGYAYTPGIHSDEQVEGWRKVTNAVHDKGGRIVLQLWHVGRMSHTDMQLDGQSPVAPSAINAGAHVFVGGEQGFAPTSDPRALSAGEMPGIVEQFRAGAIRAKEAGFDGVEIHAANGYLLHQFLSDKANHRDDAYGGAIANRIRLTVEIAEAVAEVWGPERVGIRLSPDRVADCAESDAEALYGALAGELSRIGIAFIDVVEFFGAPDQRPDTPEAVHRTIRQKFTGKYFANGGYLADSARKAIDAGHADAIIFGSTFLANPDLPERFRLNAELNDGNRDTFFGGGAEGYTDYPFLR